jgi:iron complex outermembrane receptor protein
LRLTLGARYTSDKRAIDAANILPGIATLTRQDSKTFDKFDYRVGLDYKVTPDVLVYASLTTGFKAGRFATDQIFQPPLNPEDLKAYETGVKTQFLDNRAQLNAAVFYYDYKDLQQSVLSGTSIDEINAGAAHYKGADVDFNIVPIRNLTLEAAVSYLDAKYTSFPGAPYYTPYPTGGYAVTSFDAAGKDLTRTPRWNSLLTASYLIDTSAGGFDIAGSYNYRSKYYWDFQNSTAEPATHFLNSSLTWLPHGGKYEMSLWGKNLLNEERHVYVVPGAISYISMPSEPRVLGANFTVHFK